VFTTFDNACDETYDYGQAHGPIRNRQRCRELCRSLMNVFQISVAPAAPVPRRVEARGTRVCFQSSPPSTAAERHPFDKLRAGGGRSLRTRRVSATRRRERRPWRSGGNARSSEVRHGQAPLLRGLAVSESFYTSVTETGKAKLRTPHSRLPPSPPHPACHGVVSAIALATAEARRAKTGLRVCFLPARRNVTAAVPAKTPTLPSTPSE